MLLAALVLGGAAVVLAHAARAHGGARRGRPDAGRLRRARADARPRRARAARARLQPPRRDARRHPARAQQWIADIAHELRTPLAVLRGEIEALQDGVRPLGPGASARSRRRSAASARLVDDLHALSRADVGALTYHKEPLDLAELLTRRSAGSGARSSERGIAVELSLERGPSRARRRDAPRAGVRQPAAEHAALHRFAGNGRGHAAARERAASSSTGQDSAPGVRAEADLPRLTDRLYPRRRFAQPRRAAAPGSGSPSSRRSSTRMTARWSRARARSAACAGDRAARGDGAAHG